MAKTALTVSWGSSVGKVVAEVAEMWRGSVSCRCGGSSVGAFALCVDGCGGGGGIGFGRVSYAALGIIFFLSWSIVLRSRG